MSTAAFNEGVSDQNYQGDGRKVEPIPAKTDQARPDGATRPDGPSRLEQSLQRVLPHSLEAEACVLGSMILDPNAIDIVVQICQPEDFFRPSHRLVFETLCQMHTSGKPIELFTLDQEIKQAKLIDRVGGTDYLVSLAEGVPSTANAEYYSKVVRDKSLLRNLIAANQQIISEAYDSHDDPSEVLDRAEHNIFKIAARQVGQDAASLESLMQTTFETLQNADGRITGVATGYHELDNLTCGFQKGEMIVVAARPSMGKTAFALNMAEYMGVDDNNPVLFFSLEMSKEQLAMRFLASRSRVNAGKMRRGMIGPDEWTSLQTAAGELEKAPIYIDDSADLNILRLRAKARRMQASHGIKAVFVDYLQLMSSQGRVESRQVQVAEQSRGLKGLARELNVPVVVLAQLNRGPEDRDGKRPRMSDLRESGAIEQDADVIILLHREDYYHRDQADYIPTNKTEIIVAKQRNGPVGVVELVFLAEYMRFANQAAGGGYPA